MCGVLAGAHSKGSWFPVWLLYSGDGDVHVHSAEKQTRANHGRHHPDSGWCVCHCTIMFTVGNIDVLNITPATYPYKLCVVALQVICVAVLAIDPLLTAAGLSVRYKAQLCSQYQLHSSILICSHSDLLTYSMYSI